MEFFKRKQIAHGNASSSSSLALSSSNTPAQAVGSPSSDSDAASVKGKGKSKGKLSRIFRRRGKPGHTDTAGDVVAVSSNSASPVLQANTTTTTTQPLANAQTTTIKVSPDNNNLAGTSSENATANATVILDIVKDICDMLDKVPYIKVVVGVLSTLINTINEVDACRGEWDQVQVTLLTFRDTVFKFRHWRDDSASLPDDVKDAFRGLESCLREVLEDLRQYKTMSTVKLMLERSALKTKATECIGRIDIAVQVFQTTIHVDTRIAVAQMHLDVKKILAIKQQSPTLFSSLNLDVLACPPPSQYFTGREGDLRKLSRMLAAPVVTLFSTSSNALSDFVRSFDYSSRFTAIFLDASSVEVLSMRLKVIAHNIKADDSVHQSPLLVFENADPSLELDQYLPYSLYNPILVTSTNQAISCFASTQDYKLELPDFMDQRAADGFHQSIKRAFAPKLHVVTIVARGGTGKTQLVLRFVSEDLSRFTHVWFFDATSDATLATDFKKLGKAAGFGESADDVRDFLGRMQEDWLLIFDNADDPKVELNKYIPQCNHGNIIITSRLTKINRKASPGAHLDFSDLEQSEAVNLLLKHANKDSDNNNQQLASNIVDALGCQALAVATAGAYIASTATCTLSNYLSRFNEKCTELLNYNMKSLDDYQKTVFSAFQLSFDQLSSSTQCFMQICAFFYHTAIPVELFYHAAAFTGDDLQPEEKEKTLAVEELKDFISSFTHKWSWNDSIDELSHFSLIICNTGATAFSFHPILHICIQETIINKDRIHHIALLLLARATPRDKTDVNYQFRRLLITHANFMYQNNLSTFLVYNCLGQIFSEAGLWIKAESVQQKALMYCEHYFGKHHINTLKLQSNLALTFKKLEQLKEAEMLEKETLKLCNKMLGEYHPDTLTSMGNLAMIYWELKQLEKAEVLEKETLKLRKEVLGEHHPDTLTSMSNLAVIYFELRQLEEAEVLGKETLKLRKKVLGEHHPDTFTSMSNLAMIYFELRRLEEAEVLEKETLRLCKKVLGEHHPDTLTFMSNLAKIYWELRRLEEAEVLEEETLKLCKKVLGEHHPNTLTSMSNLAIIYLELRRLEEAKVLGKETLKLHKEVLGEHHPDTLTSMSNLAMIYFVLRRLEEAEVLEKETFKLHKEVLGEHHPDTLTSMSNLAITYFELRRLEEAEILEKETLKLRKEVLGEHHPDTLTSMSNLAMIYIKSLEDWKKQILQ